MREWAHRRYSKQLAQSRAPHSCGKLKSGRFGMCRLDMDRCSREVSLIKISECEK